MNQALFKHSMLCRVAHWGTVLTVLEVIARRNISDTGY